MIRCVLSFFNDSIPPVKTRFLPLKVLGRVPSGPDPHEVVASGDGRVAYISNYNGGGNIITVVDLAGMKALPPIDLGPLRAPHGLTFVGGKLWFTAEGAKVIGPISTRP
jgi:DNA-binding beta-propeller fold protein YncE